MTVPSLRESCNKVVRDNLCHILGWIVVSGCTVAWYVVNMGYIAATENAKNSLMQANTATALDAHTAQERANDERLMQTLNQIQQDLTVLKCLQGICPHSGAVARSAAEQN